MLVACPAWALVWGPSGCDSVLSVQSGVWPRLHLFRDLFSVLSLHASDPGSVSDLARGPSMSLGSESSSVK